MVIAAATEGPNWTDFMTAFGTVGAVVAAVGIALWTEWQSSKRIRAERRHATATLKEERRLAQEREQFAQAYAIQVVEGHRTDSDEKARQTLGLNAPRYHEISGISGEPRLIHDHIYQGMAQGNWSGSFS
jgi:hypothetical protein